MPGVTIGGYKPKSQPSARLEAQVPADAKDYKAENQALRELVASLQADLAAAHAQRRGQVYEHAIERDDKGLIVRVISHPKNDG